MTIAKDNKANEDLFEQFYQRLEQDIELRNKFISLLNPDYVRRDELSKVLEELKEQREDFNKHFEKIILEMNKRFEKVDERFEQITLEMNKRFDKVFARLNEMSRAFGHDFEEGFKVRIFC